MKILMLTNTYAPHVGGVARSVQRFTETYRSMDNYVAVVAPGADGEKIDEYGVIRINALGNINGSSFSLPLLTDAVERSIVFALAMHTPDVIHSHHPFLLGDLGRRLSDRFRVPLVFTHHTMYEEYAYVLGKNKLAPAFLANLATEYANNCDSVISPSESTKKVLLSRGVRVPIEVVPTGVEVKRFASGNRYYWRERLGIPRNAPVVGHVGRLAPEKNLKALAAAAQLLLNKTDNVYFLLVGDGPAGDETRKAFEHPRCFSIGSRQGQELIDSYHAMDVFGFSSKSETQGMVLVEAMAAGVPVVAFDAPGARDVIIDGKNGKLVKEETPKALAASLYWSLCNLDTLREQAIVTAQDFSLENSAKNALSVYRKTKYIPKKLRHAVTVFDRAFR